MFSFYIVSLDPALKGGAYGALAGQWLLMNAFTPLIRNLELFSLELVRLVRALGIYPVQHPSVRSSAEKVVALAPLDSTGTLSLGVTPIELVVAGQFIGGKPARLANLLYVRKILRLLWTKDVRPEDVLVFARLLSTPKMEGAELRRKLHAEGVYSVDVEPLEIQQIHGKIDDTATDIEVNAVQRRREAWMLLMDQDTPAEHVASFLTTDQFWDDAKTAWSDLGYGDSEGFTALLLKLGNRFEAAFSLIPGAQRERVLGHLAEIGKSLSPQDLARILAREDPEGNNIGEGIISLVRDIDGPRFVDLLAGLAASGNQGTRRLVEIYRAFAPATPSEELLGLVRAKLSSPEDSGFAAGVWRTVETFILSLTEESFMDTDYSKSLDDVADSAARISVEEEIPELREDPAGHLDHVILSLAGTEDDSWQKRLLHRLETYIEQLDVSRVFGLVRLIDGVVPELIDSEAPLARTLFRMGLTSVSKANVEDRQALFEFSLHHERVLLQYVLKALSEEEQISVRHFLVDLLSRFSAAATPVYISKARNSPWQLTRNLVIVLAQQGYPQAVPALKTLSKHPHPNVRKEALKALKTIEKPSGEIEDHVS